MNNSSLNEIIKKAIILEKQGQSFYETLAERSNLPCIKRIFNKIADEERVHEKSLTALLNGESGITGESYFEYTTNPNEYADEVMTKDLLEQIDEVGYEAAAISAAISLELKSMELYKRHADISSNPEEKELFKKLADWENSHLKFISDLNRQILQRAVIKNFL